MGHMFLILVDSHSKWLDDNIMLNITSSRTIEKLRQSFSIHGLSRKIVTANGASFTSDEFKRFVEANGIKHVVSAPCHPSTNGLAERAVQTVKRGLWCIQGSSIQENCLSFYSRTRLHLILTTGIVPSKLLMGQRLRSRLDGRISTRETERSS